MKILFDFCKSAGENLSLKDFCSQEEEEEEGERKEKEVKGKTLETTVSGLGIILWTAEYQ